ncbi:MAG: hypothetical protein DRR03_07925 [Gammaproteobacteria bacterium]|nr:MAG: hypothetical protein DRR03_07925 [Gammaproteobacteria bacterium]
MLAGIPEALEMEHAKPIRILFLALVILSLAMLPGCSTMDQSYSTTRHENLSLQAGDLETHGIAFISTSASTGREEDRQAVALLFAQVLREQYPLIRVTSLSETLGKVNAANLADAYIAMHDDYRSAGLLRQEILTAIGTATGTRYLAQLRLSAFSQNSATRFGALGLRIVNTRIARVRIFFQIWDSQTGGIAWEGVEEFVHSFETAQESLVTFQSVVEESARNLVARLPQLEVLAPTGSGTDSQPARPDAS